MLGESLTALATALGAAVVQAAGTDAWAGFRGRLARLVGLGDSGRERVELERLDRTAAALSEPAGEAGERERQRQQVVWETRVADLMERLPDDQRARFAAECRALLEEAARRAERGGPAGGGGGVSGNTFHGPAAVQTGSHNQQHNHFGRGA